jgi:hypothetical protein
MKNPEYVKEWEASEEEFFIARFLIKARAEMADRMKTTQSAIACLEDGANQSIKRLLRYAKATGTRIEIKLTKV